MNSTNDIFSSNHHYEDSYKFSDHQQATISEAIGILENRIKTTDAFTSPSSVKRFCQLRIGAKLDELFCCLFLDTQHRLIAFEYLFRGTVDSASIYPRVVIRRSLEFNAAAIIFTHNHPSGITTPSTADIAITKRLTEALRLIDIRVLDHIVVSVAGSSSMAERGLL